jgi:hypothetical protein
VRVIAIRNTLILTIVEAFFVFDTMGISPVCSRDSKGGRRIFLGSRFPSYGHRRYHRRGGF